MMKTPTETKSFLNNYPEKEVATMFKAGMVPALVAARLLGVSSTAVYTWLSGEKVKGEVCGGRRRYITLASLRAHIGDRVWFACKFDKLTLTNMV